MNLQQEGAVVRMASELGVDMRDPVAAIIEYCKKRIRGWVREAGGVQTIDQLESLVCRRLRLVFEEVSTDEDLERIIQKYVRLGEPVFLKLRTEFDDDTYATLLERRKIDGRAEDRYVAVIDCRGKKRFRRFFTRWHEIAHLLTLHRQLELPLHRSTARDPLERLMDAVAGEVGFYEPLFRPVLLAELRAGGGRLNLATVDRVRASVCPEASFQATLSSCVKRTPAPLIYLEAGMGYKKHEQAQFAAKRRVPPRTPAPKRKLRALTVIPNNAARELGLRIDRNMQIPVGSVAYFESLVRGTADETLGKSGFENLATWTHSNGTCLDDVNVFVDARAVLDRVIAIVRPVS